jgi:hypothetical protein
VLRVVALWLAGCGRLGFQTVQPVADSAVVDTPPPAVVQTSSNQTSGSATITLSIAPTLAGDLIVVATGGWAPGSPVTSITDNAGNSYVSTNAMSNLSNLPNKDIVEIWYATNARAGATSVVVTASVSSNREAWLLEASGVSAADVVATLDNASAARHPAAPPISPTVTPSLIVAVGDFAAAINGLLAGSSFTQLPIHDDNDATWLIVENTGSYSAVWDAQSTATYCVSVAAFK